VKRSIVSMVLFLAMISLLQVPALAWLQKTALAWENVGSPINVNIPPHKAFIRAFDLVARGRLRVNYTVQSGQMDIYLMTQEQHNRASAGQEPTQINRDFITKNSGVLGSGSTISPDLNPGRYAVIFRNLGESPIQVSGGIQAEAR
jgi:hypothetical protein